MPELMKGHVWHERKDARDRKGNPIVTYPVYVEDKHDEIRCHVTVIPEILGVEFLSYAGKPLANMHLFADAMWKLWKGTGYKEFDLGFECNGNFNDSYRWVRSTRGIPEDLVEATFKFYIFGLPEQKGDLMNQQIAREEVADCAEEFSIPLVLPHMVVCGSEEDVESAFLDARARGLEGVMVKQPAHPYQRKRTDAWLKMKPESDADGEIVGFIEAICGKDQPEKGLREGDRLRRIGSVQVRCEDGSTAAPHGIPHDLGKAMFNSPESFLGQWCEFKYMERDRQGGYRHPTFHRLREAKK